MNLYDRDFSTLTKEEETEWRSLQQQETVGTIGRFKIVQSRFRQYPKAVRHYLSLFPNNYLDIVELEDERTLREILDSFRRLLDSSDVGERAILNFINQNCAYFVVGSLLKSYFHFGHHDAYLFPEFPLGTSYKVDYLLAGRSSDGWHLVFVELEAPLGAITLASGELGLAFRKGLAQIADWDAWIEAHYGALSEVFDKHRSTRELLPDEFRLFDKSRLHYVVIAGRRTHFNERTYRTRRKSQPRELILHYDNLADAADNIIGSNTY